MTGLTLVNHNIYVEFDEDMEQHYNELKSMWNCFHRNLVHYLKTIDKHKGEPGVFVTFWKHDKLDSMYTSVGTSIPDHDKSEYTIFDIHSTDIDPVPDYAATVRNVMQWCFRHMRF